MLSSKISAQTLVFIAFFAFITIPTAKSEFKKCLGDINKLASTTSPFGGPRGIPSGD
jgi:hypothetical protein